MNHFYPEVIRQLIDHFRSFPGVGPKSAERMAFFLVKNREDLLKPFQESFCLLESGLNTCSDCGIYSDNENCLICSDPRRQREILCLVEDIQDLYAIEQTGQFHGLYHVLGGSIAPLKGIAPADLRIKELLRRLKDSEPTFKEIIFALNPTLEGETTMLYLKRLIYEEESGSPEMSQIVYGVPLGGQLEFTDKVTLGHSFKSRKKLQEKQL